MVPPPLLDRMAAGGGGSPPLLYPFSLKALCGGWLPGQRQRMDPASGKKGGKVRSREKKGIKKAIRKQL